MIKPLLNRDLLVKADFESGQWLWQRNKDGIFEGCSRGYLVGRGIPFSIQCDLHSWFIEGQRAFGEADTINWQEEDWAEYEAKGEALAHQVTGQSMRRFSVLYANSSHNPAKSIEKPKELPWDKALHGLSKYGYPIKANIDRWEGKITICFGHADAGWVQMVILTTTEGFNNHFVGLSEVFDPFPSMVKWFTMIANGESATMEVDEEGHSTWFTFSNINEQLIEFLVEADTFDKITKFSGTERKILAVVNRRAFIKEFHRRFTDFLANEYQQDKWADIDPDDYYPEELIKISQTQPPSLDLSHIRNYLEQKKDVLQPLVTPQVFGENEIYELKVDEDVNDAVVEGSDTESNEGHGDHWQAIDENYTEFISTMIPRICEEGKLDGSGDFSFDSFKENGLHPLQGTTFGLRHMETPIQYFALVAAKIDNVDQSKDLWSAYPVCAEGITHRLCIDAIHPWKNTIEGVLEASIPGGAGVIWFFDPFFYRNKDEYIVSREVEICIAGLAYTFRKAETADLEITAGAMLDIHRQQLLDRNPDVDVSEITSVPISMKGAAIYFPRSTRNGDADIRTQVKCVEYFEVAGKEFCRIRGTIMKPGEQSFDAYIYVASHVLQEYRPEVGDDIDAFVWMQGYLLPPSYTPTMQEQEYIDLSTNPVQARLAMNYALAYNTLNTRWITTYCNEHVEYKPRLISWNTSDIKSYAKQLKERFKRLMINARTGSIRCELATNPADGAPGVIFYQSESDYDSGIGVCKFWVDILPDDTGKFAAITFSVNSPSPSNVSGSGLFPGISTEKICEELSYRPLLTPKHKVKHFTVFVQEPMTETDQALLASVKEIADDYPCVTIHQTINLPANFDNDICNECCRQDLLATPAFALNFELIVEGYRTPDELRNILGELTYTATAEEQEKYAISLLNDILEGKYFWHFDNISNVLDQVVAIIEPLGLEEKLDTLLNMAVDYNTVALLKGASQDAEDMEKKVMAQFASMKKCAG